MPSSPASHVPPQNIEAEESVLGAMLVAEPTLTRVIDEVKLSAADFYLDRHRAIFEAIHDLYATSKPVDELSVAEALTQANKIDEAGGKHYVSELAAKVPAAGNAKHYAEIVQQNSLLRRLLGAGQEIQGWVNERDGEPRELSERAEKLLFEVAHKEQASDFRMLGDILHDEVDRLEKLSTGETELTGTPSGFRDIDAVTGGFQPGNLIIIAARPAMGKCESGRSLIYDPTTGARRRLDSLFEAHRRGEEVWVASLGPGLQVVPAKVAAIESNGRKPVYRLTTRLGRWTEATANHPVLTSSGWRELGDVAAGTRIAVPRRLPRPSRPTVLPDHEVVVLAARIAGGAGRGGAPASGRGSGAANAATVESHRGPGPEAKSNPISRLLARHGLAGLRPAELFVPDAIFGLADDQLARFLAVLYGCAGHFPRGDRAAQIAYATPGERLARDLQHLLLRLGIVASIRTPERAADADTGTLAREVLITDGDGLRRFCELIRVPGMQDVPERPGERSAAVRRPPDAGAPPAEARDHVARPRGERIWTTVGAPERPAASLAVAALCDADIWWDEVASVEYVGEEETYDLDVPGLRNFVADDVIVHNSALVANIAENVAVKRHRPVAFFSLEMSEVELAQRFIACRARIPGDKLRKGQVSQRDWPKVVRACNELEQAPLWFDDSSDLGILDLRAKARRLHATEQERGGLGLIIVDYMQLMRSDDARANRVEQVGQISRGLKILARELQVPVMAISQLSRAPEQRSPPRPQLSDLRESGQIEQDADLVAFLYRQDYYRDPEEEPDGLANLIIAKHRNGPIATKDLVFLDRYPKFADYSGQEAPIEQPVGEDPPPYDEAAAAGPDF